MQQQGEQAFTVRAFDQGVSTGMRQGRSQNRGIDRST